ncbi:hypothetical protein PFLA_a2429 [Pseudoalteromonas flavipulchra NCIMB 2033 = ATCC BAA-314]|nr:hypothetical protein [Pseudoalteromonas flavipulchra NCIMB 2033 = ATCC BAA-314]
MLPLKFSKVFDEIFKSKKSISQLQAASPLAKFQYREVSKQFDAIYSLILPKNESKK